MPSTTAFERLHCAWSDMVLANLTSFSKMLSVTFLSLVTVIGIKKMCMEDRRRRRRLRRGGVKVVKRASAAQAQASSARSAVKARTFIIVGRARVYHNKSERRAARIPRAATLPAVRRRQIEYRAYRTVMTGWLLVVLVAGAAAAGGRMPRTSAPAAPAPPPAPAPAPRLPLRNVTLSSRNSVRNRSVSH